MKQITSTTDFILATGMCRELQAAGIQAELTNVTDGAFTMEMIYLVWIPDHADLAAAKAIAGATPGVNASRATRVSASEGSARCRSCGYDLRGQISDGQCPECGKEYYLVGMRQCPTCGTKVPGDYEVCWNCSNEITPEEP